MILDVKNLSVHYKVGAKKLSAVDNVSFDIAEGETFALVGESGCGKSTIAYALTQLLLDGNEQVEGEAFFKGKELLTMPKKDITKIRGNEIGMVFQNPLNSLNPVYKVSDQVAEPFVINQHFSKKDVQDLVLQSFKDVRINDAEHKINSYPHEMSGGQLQRVVISISTSQKPSLLIADEPTTALDVTIEGQILKLIKELKNEEGENVSVLLITHNFGAVAEIADKVGVMYGGNLVEIGDVFTIFSKPTHPYTKLLLKSLPTGKKSDGPLATIDGVVPRFTEETEYCRFVSRCPYAKDICRNEKPALHDLGNGHYCMCHFAGGEHE